MDKEVQKLITLKPRVLSTFSLCMAAFLKANREIKDNEPKTFILELRVKLDLPVNHFVYCILIGPNILKGALV